MRSVLPEMGKYSATAKRIVALAELVGWKSRMSTSGHMVTVYSPTHEKRVVVPAVNMNADRARSSLSQVLTHTPTEKLFTLLDGSLDMRTHPDHAGVVAVTGTSLISDLADYLVEKRDMDAAVVQEALAKVTPPKPAVVVPETTPEWRAAVNTAMLGDAHPKPAPPPVTSVHEVSRGPWLARGRGSHSGAGGNMYPSPVVVDVIMSDGTHVYECWSPDCDYTHANPRSVASHTARAHKDENPEKSNIIIPVEMYEPSGIHRQSSAAHRLALDLVRALDGIEGWREMDPLALADAMAGRVYDDRPERPAMEPLTPEQILDRIASLTAGPRLADAHNEIQKMTAALAEASRLRDEAVERAETLRGNLRAMKELAQELDK